MLWQTPTIKRNHEGNSGSATEEGKTQVEFKGDAPELKSKNFFALHEGKLAKQNYFMGTLKIIKG